MDSTAFGDAPAVSGTRIRLARPWRLAAAIGVPFVLVALAAAGYLVHAEVAGGQILKQASTVIESARTHNNQIADALKSPSFGAPLNDSSDAKAAAGSVATMDSALGGADTTLAAQLASLRKEDRILKEAQDGPWLLPSRSELASQQRRVDALITAFTSAQAELGVVRRQITGIQAFLSAAEQLQTIEPYVQQQDAAGALKLYAELEARLRTAATESPNMPPQLKTAVGLMTTIATDLKQFLQAEEAGDYTRAEAVVGKLQTDADAMKTYDGSGIDAYETGLLSPYKNAYEKALTQAGFTVTP